MSTQALAWVFDNSRSKGSTRCVMMAIANHIDAGDGEGWAFVAQVLKDANCSLDTYRRAVQWAIDNGELEREPNEGGTRRMKAHRRPNAFRFPGFRRPLQVADPIESMPPADCGGGTPAGCGGQWPLQVADPEPSLWEPSLEPSQPLAPAPPPLKRERERDEVWDALIGACGLTGAAPTPSERGGWNKAVRDLKAAGATPVEITHRAREYRNRWPNMTLTPTALARHWSECVATPPVSEGWDGPTIGEDPLLPRARSAVDELTPGARRHVPRDALMGRALEVLEQNPDVSSVDLVMALEVWVDAHYPMAASS